MTTTTSEYWPLVLENLRHTVKDSVYKAWFEKVVFVKISNQGRKIELEVPNAFNKKYIQTKYSSSLLECLNKYYPQVIHIDLVVNADNINQIQQEQILPEDKPKKQKTSINSTYKSMEKAEEKGEEVASYLPKKNINNLNPRYTLENFVVTANNEFAYNVANAVIDEPGKVYNPVFLYGGVGLGKTHLIQAIGQKMLENNPSFNIKYIPMETFVTQFMIAVRNQQMQGFKNYYRSIDLLLIDDVQFIAGKESTQNEFFHTFNSLSQENKQIIFTSDRPPTEINGIADRLISRFGSGVTVDISKPDFEARLAILNDKIERLNIKLSEEYIQLIAEKVDTNIRELEGVLNKICAKIKFNPGKEFTMDDLHIILDSNSTPSSSSLTFGGNGTRANSAAATERFMHAVCRHYGLDKADVLGVSRQKDISLARQVIMYFYKHELDMSYPTIGRLFGNRDHTTVMHAARKISTLVTNDSKMKQQLQVIKQACV
jgi:chromosomal replication initiator protein